MLALNAYDDIAQYIIYRATYSFAGFQAGVSSNTVSQPATNYIDTGLNPKITYYYRVSALDMGDQGNGYFSYVYGFALSSITSSYTPDTTPPDPISQITALTGAIEGQINLAWTSPGDDGSVGNIVNGQFRVDYTTNSLKNFTTSSYQINITTSVSPGDQNFITITGLNSGSTYYFRVWTADPAGNWSGLSAGATAWAQYDITPPSAISNIIVTPFWRGVTLNWTSPGDDGDFGVLLGSYEIRTNLSPITNQTQWDAVPIGLGYPYRVVISTTAQPGSLQSAVITGLTDGLTYYFAVRATDDWGNQSAVYAVSPSASPSDHVPSTFSLIGPADYSIATSTPVVFTWNASSDLDVSVGDSLSYRIYYSTDSSFATAVTQINYTGTNLGVDLSAYEDMTVYWRVDAIDLDNNVTHSTPYSRSIRIKTYNNPPGPFNLSAPLNDIILPTATPTLTWTASTDPDPGDIVSYQVDLSTSQNFAVVISSQFLSSPSYTTPQLIENATYWWRVWATDSALKVMSNTTGYFRVNAVLEAPFAFNLSTPTDSMIFTTTTVNFSWAPTYSPDPDSSVTYDLSLSQVANFSSSITITGLTQTTTNYSNFTDHSLYYWCVTARCSNTLNTQSSQINKFYVDTFQILPSTFSLIQPGYNVVISTSLTPLFTWAPTTVPDPEDQVRYTFYISPRPDFTGLGTTAVNTGTDNFYIPITNLTDQTTYYWRVLAAGYQGSPWNTIPVQVDTGTWSSVSTFVISMVDYPPQSFALSSPASGTTLATKTPLLKWGQAIDTNVNSAISYSVIISTSSDFSTTAVFAQGITGTQYQVTTSLNENKTYYWKVIATDSRNVSTTSTSIFSFNIPVLTIPQAPMGFKGLLSSDKLSFQISWSPVAKNADGSNITDLASYNIYRGSEQLMVFIANVPAGTNQWTDGSMQGVEYYYRVSAVNSSGVESILQDSPLLDSLSQDTLTYMSDDKSLLINVPAQVTKYMLAQNNSYAKDLRIKFEHNPSAETDKILLSYLINVVTADGTNIDKFNFAQPLTANFGYGSTTFAGKRLAMMKVPAVDLGELNIYWNNSIEYMRVGGTLNASNQQVSIMVLKTGEYQLRRVSRVAAFSVASVYPPKVFTPNIAPYQTIIFYVDNPQGDKVTGKIFNLRGEHIADLASDGDPTATSVILSWDGKNSNGVYVTKGVYIYQLEGSGKIINGTIMVAR